MILIYSNPYAPIPSASGFGKYLNTFKQCTWEHWGKTCPATRDLRCKKWIGKPTHVQPDSMFVSFPAQERPVSALVIDAFLVGSNKNSNSMVTLLEIPL